MTLQLLIIAVFVIAFTAIAMTIDLKKRKIPNWLTLPAFLCGIVFHSVSGGFAGFGFAMGGFGVGFGLLLVLWLVGGGGGGDVKLMGALGAWLGASLTFIVFVAATLIAVVMTVVLRIQQVASKKSLSSAGAGDSGDSAVQDLSVQKTQGIMIPFAVPVAFGTWIVVGAKLITLWMAG